MPRRVALLSFEYGEIVVPLANALADHAQVLVQLPSEIVSRFGSALRDDIEVHEFAKPRLREPAKQASTMRSIVRAVDRFSPDVWHVQQGHLWFNLAMPLLGRRPTVVTVHDHAVHSGDLDSAKTPQRVMDIAFRRADHLITHTHFVKAGLRSRAGLGRRPITVVPHHVPGAVDPPREMPPRPTVLFLGRIWPYKGLEVLLRAQPLVSRAVADARFVVAGRSDRWPSYERQIVDRSRFELHPTFVTDTQRDELLRTATVVALPYTDATQSGVIPLAYRFGRPVVASSVGGIPEQVDVMRTGLLVPPGDHIALADALVRILADPSLAASLSRNAAAKAAGDLSPAAAATSTVAVYDELLATVGASR